MQKRLSILILSFSIQLYALGQVEKEGVAVLEGGDTLRGTFRYEEGRLFAGVEFLDPPEASGAPYLPADTLSFLYLDTVRYKSLTIGKKEAGVKSRSLAARKMDGAMSLYEGRYRRKSCSCQDHASVRKAAFIRKEGEGRFHLVKKNRFLDRIKNADELASAFLPHEDLMEAVKDREYTFSGIGKAVERYNRRSKSRAKP